MPSPKTLRHLAAMLLLAGLLPLIGISQATSLGPADHVVTLTGAGVTTYPAFTQETERYGIRTTAATNGTLDVTASTSDPSGRVFVNGRLSSGSVPLTGLAPRDEVSVIIKDALGTSVYSFIYLPATFPALTASAQPGMQEGHTLATLGTQAGETPRYMSVMDANAVPRFFQQYAGNRHDFKQRPDGTYSVSADQRDATAVPERILHLNERFEQVGTHRTVNLVDTDFHESVYLPNGHVILMAYEPRNDGSGLIDSVIQEQDPTGDPVFTWSTRNHVDLATEPVTTSLDYAHLNSIEVLDDGDLLASFRNLTSVFKIARTAHDGFAEGQVIWRLGGRLSDFTFADPVGGPCMQHTAGQTNSAGQPMRVLVFDNGANAATCVDPADPSGPTVARPFSRAVEWELDPVAGTATKVFEEAPTDADGQVYFGRVTGSAYRMPNGNTLIGWGNNVAETTASEVTPAGDVVWELENPADGAANPVPNYNSYRYHRAVTRDAFAPTVTVDVPADGATYAYAAPVTASYGCTDTGGSSLVDCSGPADSGSPVATTTPGTHTFTVTARDGDGNTTSRNVTYTVLPGPVAPPTTGPTTTSSPQPTSPVPPARGPRPDAILLIRGPVAGNDVQVNGNGVYSPTRQRSRLALTEARPRRALRLRVGNDGDVTSVLTVDGPASPRGVEVRAMHGTKDVTRRLARGTLRITLAPGAESVIRLRVTRTAGPSAAARALLSFSVASGDVDDVVQLRVLRRP